MTYRPWQPVKVLEQGKAPMLDTQITPAQDRCLKALSGGTAGPDEQRIAFSTILHICGVDDLEYLPAEHGGERDSAFKSGKRHIGLQLRKLVNLPLNLSRDEK